VFSHAAATKRDEGTNDVGITAGRRFELHNALAFAQAIIAIQVQIVISIANL
jgi:hypothetical protein